MMEVTIQVPEDIATRWQKCGDVPRGVLESVALEAYRQRVVGESRLQEWLGLETRFEVHDFLKAHGVPLNYSLEDLKHDNRPMTGSGYNAGRRRYHAGQLLNPDRRDRHSFASI
jgi:hypothetical protein